jgi:RNA polymerase nonessential primary-like sigma factor
MVVALPRERVSISATVQPLGGASGLAGSLDEAEPLPDPDPLVVPSARVMPSIDGDLVRSYLRDIGRVPLLSHEQEITLGRQVQELMALEELREELMLRSGGQDPADQELAEAADLTLAQLKRRLQAGRRAKERMVAANLRLVVSVAKKYTKRNM